MSIFKRRRNKFTRVKTGTAKVSPDPLTALFDLTDGAPAASDKFESPFLHTQIADNIPDDARYTLKKVQSQKKAQRHLYASQDTDLTEDNPSLREQEMSKIDDERELAAIQKLKKNLLKTNDIEQNQITSPDTASSTASSDDMNISTPTDLDIPAIEELDAVTGTSSDPVSIEAFEQDMSHIAVVETDEFERESLDFEPVSNSTTSQLAASNCLEETETRSILSESLLPNIDMHDSLAPHLQSSDLLKDIEIALDEDARTVHTNDTAHDNEASDLTEPTHNVPKMFEVEATRNIDDITSQTPPLDLNDDINNPLHSEDIQDEQECLVESPALAPIDLAYSEVSPVSPEDTETISSISNDMSDDTAETPNMSHLGDKNIHELRHDISKISADVENGDALYRRAQARIKNLTSFAEKAEVSFSLVARLEPENRRLKARNLSLTRNIEKSAHIIACLEKDLLSHKERLSEVLSDLETTTHHLSQTTALLGTAEKDLATAKQERDVQTLRGDREQNAYNIEKQENENLRAKISKLSSELEANGSEKVSLLNQSEALKVELEDQREARASSEKNALDLAIELEMTRKQNNEMTIQISSINEDIKSFKTQYEYNLMTRDDRIFALEAEIEGLTKQLSLKDEILSNTSQNAENLRKTRSDSELERERLEQFISNQSEQLKLAEAQLLKSRANIHELDKRYKDAAIALSHVHKRRNTQFPSNKPDIHPAITASEIEDAEPFSIERG